MEGQGVRKDRGNDMMGSLGSLDYMQIATLAGSI